LFLGRANWNNGRASRFSRDKDDRDAAAPEANLEFQYPSVA
jgi:hypothetical protein